MAAMSPQAASSPVAAPPHRTGGDHRLRNLLLRRIWLPRWLYAAVPAIYLGSGTGALLGGLYLPDPSWMLPYVALFGFACLHAGITLIAMRRRRRTPA